MENTELVCRKCGTALSPSDRFCRACGAKVEESSAVSAVPVRCEICGHENRHSGLFCEACGAKLPGRAPAPAQRPPKKKPAPTAKSSFFKNLQPWHYAIAVLLGGVLVVLLYTELQRDTATDVAQRPAMQFPAMQQATPPSKEILDTIERLQKAVAENPSDAGAQLMLANALHDAGTHDASFFPRAIDAYKKYLKAKPGDPNARVDLGICYFELGKVDSSQSAQLFSMAINEMETAVRNTPSHQPGAFNLGIVYLYSGNLEESNKWLKRTVDLNAESDLGRRAKAILEQHKQAG